MPSQFSISLIILALPLLSFAEIHPERVLIVVNKSDPASIEIGNYYAQKRNIPKKNIFQISPPNKETISWDEFITYIFNPLRIQLVKSKWLNGILYDKFDKFGRIEYIPLDHKIDFLVFSSGIPYRIKNNPELIEISKDFPINTPEFCVTNASVDNELTLLCEKNSPVIGFVINPIYKVFPLDQAQKSSIIRTSRLDGPNEACIKQMIDNALYTEKQGLRGRAYIDLEGPYPKGNEWLTHIAQSLKSLGFETIINTKKGKLFTKNDRFDDPIFYFGWHTKNITGPFTNPDFKFPPGAIAIHIHSHSAIKLRSTQETWVGPFIARGVTATIGNVYEPYLDLSHHIDILWEGLTKNLSWGEATYYSLISLSWQTIVIGDPLYQPFKKKVKNKI